MDCKRLLAYVLFLLPAIGMAQDSTRNKLEEVEVTDNKQSNFGHMYQVDGMKITAGKKSEVISVEHLNVNKATNNTRQVYAKVAGLNIFENDGSGLQLSIGGRGLDPNRTSNFNVRQNGYDISADALGYPESYYTPPAEALSKNGNPLLSRTVRLCSANTSTAWRTVLRRTRQTALILPVAAQAQRCSCCTWY